MESVTYQTAQRAIADLKASIHALLSANPDKPMKNSEIGRSLGNYSGHVDHEGHISRTLLEMMKNEGVVEQNSETKAWSLKKY